MELTYLQFHLVFVLPVVVGLLYLCPQSSPVRRRRGAVGIGILVTIAFAYTTPWGSYMIQQGAWWYGDGFAAVAGRQLQVPLGEYLFFVLQTVIVGLYLYVRGFDPTFHKGDFALLPRIAGVAAGLGLLGGGLYLVTLGDSYLYLGGLIAWVGPVFALQWAVGGGYLVRQIRPWAEAAVVPSVYFWVADRTAIEVGTWVISKQYTTGVTLLGLPVEEMLFFISASLMTVYGLVLFEWVLDYNDQTGMLDQYVPAMIMQMLTPQRVDDRQTSGS